MMAFIGLANVSREDGFALSREAGIDLMKTVGSIYLLKHREPLKIVMNLTIVEV